MRLHLVRHGHTDALGHVLAGRAPGFGLNAHGAAQAAALAHGLSGAAVTRVLSSPQLRARQTAEPIARAAGCTVEVEAGLDEVDFGAWNGLRFDELDSAPGWAAWNGVRSLAPTPGGETMLQVQARAVGVLQCLAGPAAAETDRGGELVLVSHADVLRALLAYALGMSIDLMHRMALSPAGRSVVSLAGNGIVVEAVNLPPGR